jgi:hypothetical protein
MERRAAITGMVVSLAATAVLGLLAGLIWGQVAPRAQLQEVSAGVAQVVNAETRAFIGADGWYCVIAAVGGVLTGISGYLLGIRRRGNVAQGAVTIGLILGAVAASFVMRWLGEQSGYQAYQHQLAHAAAGATFSSSLTLGAKSALAFWPLFTSLVIVLAEVGRRRRDPGQELGPVSSMWTDPQGSGGAP